MSNIEIPIALSESHFEQENEVFGQNFTYEFEWIELEAFWMLHIFDDHQTPLAVGVKLQPDCPLYVYHLSSSSIIFMLAATSMGETLSRETLKTHFALVAYEAF